MEKKDRFPGGYSSAFAPSYESEESGSSGRIDGEIEVAASENSSAPRKKWVMLNSTSQDGFGVPVKVLPISKMSVPDRENLLLRLRAELEQIMVLKLKVESQKANTVSFSSSSNIISCSNVQNGLTTGNVRKSSALTGDPGKTLHSNSMKARALKRGTSGRFLSSGQPSAPLSQNTSVMKQCESLLKKLMSHEHGWVFNSPVDVVKLNLPDYHDVIKHPMDLGTIKRKISSCEYTSPLDFLADVRLTFANAMTYNPPGNDVHLMADTLSKFFEVRWKVIGKKISGNVSQPLPEVSGRHSKTEEVKPAGPSKKRKLSSTQIEVLPEPVKRIMTGEEKEKLSRELESSLADLPDNIIEFLKEQSSTGNDAGEDEIEIDIDVLSDDTLFKLQKLLDDFLTDKQKQARCEPCEIELLNESGLSNSSLQLDKGNEIITEDVDTDGNDSNEPPVSSYPPTEIQKDSGCRNNKCISPRTSNDSDSRSYSGMVADVTKASPMPLKLSEDDTDHGAKLNQTAGGDLVDRNQSVSDLDHLEPSQQMPYSVESDCCQDGDSAPTERPVSPDKLYRVALLKNRFADTILKAREKTLKQQGEKGNPERLRLEREELESQKRKEKARLQAEAKAAEDARRQAEATAIAESKRQRELEREAARQALLKMEKTVEINGTSRFLEDLEMLRTVPPEPLLSSVDETSPDQSLDCFKFGGSNPLEQLGLYMKDEDDDEEIDPPSNDVDVEEGEID